MAKNVYSKPLMFVEKFTPQEFVATCEDKNKWGATCVSNQTQPGFKGYVFYDDDNDMELDYSESRLTDYVEHGGCGRTHYFYSETAPTFNGWVLSHYKLGGHSIYHYLNNGYLTDEGKALLTPALIKKPGEVFDRNWLVCISLDDLRNPS